MIDKPKTKNTEAEENLKKAEFNCMIDSETLIEKTSVDAKSLQLKICVRNKYKNRAPEEFSPVYSEFNERSGLLFAQDKIVIPDELKRSTVDVHFGHPGSGKMLAESNIFWWSGMKKDIENKCSTSTACMSSGKNLKCHLPSTEKIRRPALTEPGQEIQIDFSGKLHNKLKGEPYMLIGIDRYSKRPVVWISKSTEKKSLNF